MMEASHPLSLQQQQVPQPQALQMQQQQMQQMMMMQPHLSAPMDLAQQQSMMQQMQMQPQMVYASQQAAYASSFHGNATLSSTMAPPPPAKKRAPPAAAAGGLPGSKPAAKPRAKKPRLDHGPGGENDRPGFHRAQSNRAGPAANYSSRPSGSAGHSGGGFSHDASFSTSYSSATHALPRSREKIIVLVPGSDTLKIGFVEQPRPSFVRQVLACRRNGTEVRQDGREQGQVADEEMKDGDDAAPSFSSTDGLDESDLSEADQSLLDQWRRRGELDRDAAEQTLEALRVITVAGKSTEKAKRRGQFQSTKAPTAPAQVGPKLILGAGSIEDAANVIQMPSVSSTIVASKPPAPAPRFLHSSTLTSPLLSPLLSSPHHCYTPLYPYSRRASSGGGGGMNVAEAAEYGGEMRSLSVCMEWQEEILREAFKTELHLTSAAALTQYSVCLVVPDCWHSSEISAFLTLLLCRLDFTAVFLLRESVATAYGAGLATACVVDLGAFGTRVACVEEGVVMQRTVRYLNYGSADIEGVIAHSVQEHQLWTRMENAVRAAAQKGEWDRESMLVLRRAEQLRLWKEHFSYFLTSSADDTSSLIQQPVLAYSHSPSEVPTAVPEELQFAAVLGPLAYFYPSLFHTALRTLDDPHRARILEKMKAREDPYAELLPSSVVNSAATTLVEGNVLFDPTGAMLEEELQLLATETNESVLERSKKITAAPPPAPEAATKKSDETAAPPDATTSSTDAAPVFRLDRRRKDHQLLLERYTESELLSGAHLKSEAEEERKQKEIATFRLDRRRKDHQMLLERYTEEQLMAGQHLKDAEEERKEKEKKEQALLQQQQQQQDAAMNTSDPSSAAGTPSTVHRRLSSLVASSAHSHPPRTAVESFLAHREPLHLAIARSIQAAAATVAGERGREQGEASGLQLQCKLATSIILTGGGSNLPRVLPAVEERLVDVFPYLLPGVPSVACLLHPKGLDSHQLSWRGGAIVARGEGSHGKDMWLTSEEWRRHGVRLLREKASWMVV